MRRHTFSRTIRLALPCLVAVAATLPAQAPSPFRDEPARAAGMAPVLAGTPDEGLPGARPGTERWIVHFDERSFDLSAFRNAIRDVNRERQTAELVAQIVSDLEASVLVDQADFVTAVQALGGTVDEQWWIINAAVVEIDPARLPAIRRLPNVAFIEPDESFEAWIRVETNANNHNAVALHGQGHFGAGATVGIMDTGQDEDMNGSGRPQRMYFLDGDPTNTSGAGIGGSRLVVNRQIGALIADDQQGHGTGVASIAAAAPWGTSSSGNGHAPQAQIAGYAIANQVQGGASSSSTMTSAWQAMASDRAQYNIVAANLSYGGNPNPLNSAQQAIDSASLNADIMCCASAGNSSSSTQGSQSNVNGLSVAALNPNSHTVASFSSRGPLSGDSQRFYPDIAACGVSTIMARRDSETRDYVGSGTSMASPMVAGAATQLRARFTNLTALETRTILLASTLDLSQQNPTRDRNAYGMGLLRNDRAHDLADLGNFGTSTVSSASPTHTVQFPVTAGTMYAVAVGWHRQNLQSNNWSNLDLEIVDANGTVLSSSTTPRNTYEMVRFFSPTSGTVTIRTVATSISGTSDQPFSYAWTEAPRTPIAGEIASFGQGCQGTGMSPAICAGTNTNGGTLTNTTRRNEYAYDLSTPTAIVVEGFEIFSSSTSSTPQTVTARIYGSNGSGPTSSELASVPVTIGATPGFYGATFQTPVSIPAGSFWIGIDHSAETTYLCGVTGGESAGAFWRRPAGSGSWSRSSLVDHAAIRVACVGGGSNNATPTLNIAGDATIGGTVTPTLGRAAAGAPAILLLGGSDSTWSGGSLPVPLGTLGAPGCSLLVSNEIEQPLVADPQGSAQIGLSIPNDTVLLGRRIFGQAFVIDAGANTLGVAATNGMRLSIGG